MLDFQCVVGLKSAFQHAIFKVLTTLYVRVLVICNVLLYGWAGGSQCSKEMQCPQKIRVAHLQSSEVLLESCYHWLPGVDA